MNNNRKMTQLQKFNLLLTITIIIVLTNIIS